MYRKYKVTILKIKKAHVYWEIKVIWNLNKFFEGAKKIINTFQGTIIFFFDFLN